MPLWPRPHNPEQDEIKKRRIVREQAKGVPRGPWGPILPIEISHALSQDEARYGRGKPRKVKAWRLPCNPNEAGMVELATLNATVEHNPADGRLRHIPDCDGFWDENEWKRRQHVHYELNRDEECPSLEGYYVVFFTVENAELRHQNDNFDSLDVVLVRGDAFTVEVSDVGYDLDSWAVYEDVPQEFLSDESSALKETLINVIKKGAIDEAQTQSRDGKPPTIKVWVLPYDLSQEDKLVELTTADTSEEHHLLDGKLTHIPDLRHCWRVTPNVWCLRETVQYTHAYDKGCPSLEGHYIVFFALSKSTRHQNDESGSSTPVYGDVFVAKVSGPRQDMSCETAYVDVPEEYLSEKSFVLRNALILCVARRVEEALVKGTPPVKKKAKNKTGPHTTRECYALTRSPVSENSLRKRSQNLNSMPDPRSDWGLGWNDRRVVWFFTSTNNERNPAHGWYAIFMSGDTGYTPNRNINFKSEGNSVHKDVFIAKAVYQGKDKQGRISYMDIPKKFIEQDALNTVTGNYPTTGGFLSLPWMDESPVEFEEKVMRQTLSG
ncbi:hypothetical protein OEA41_007498 [Lepraria neglecta]|uniref:Uncharacterized protein n=1 Tax=Lepraria neglecta TaxID=209136 RepID=A0AAE0DQI1_9LECA|nr:hypothetical protein OEA41_007498 [Lepraria neglecta]